MINRVTGYDSGAPGQAEEIKAKATDLVCAARERLSEGTQTVRQYIVERPAWALGLAVGIGVFLGWLTKRR